VRTHLRNLASNHMHKQRLRAFVGFAWGLLLFLAIAWSLKFGLRSVMTSSAVVGQLVLKTTLVVVAMLGWKLLRRPFREMGWHRAALWNRSYLVWFSIAAGAMIAGTVAMLFLGTRHPIASQMSFAQIVAVIWLLSSFSEEVYVRGLVQSWVADGDDSAGASSPFAPSTVSSALVFAAMHAPLMWSQAGVKGGLTLVLTTLVLGWACAVLRVRSKSLIPAIACHVVGNIASLPGGILGAVLYRLVYGHLPEILSSG
jgi:membrane protease YdiL (CAAX protease family)